MPQLRGEARGSVLGFDTEAGKRLRRDAKCSSLLPGDVGRTNTRAAHAVDVSCTVIDLDWLASFAALREGEADCPACGGLEEGQDCLAVVGGELGVDPAVAVQVGALDLVRARHVDVQGGVGELAEAVDVAGSPAFPLGGRHACAAVRFAEAAVLECARPADESAGLSKSEAGKTEPQGKRP